MSYWGYPELDGSCKTAKTPRPPEWVFIAEKSCKNNGNGSIQNRRNNSEKKKEQTG